MAVFPDGSCTDAGIPPTQHSWPSQLEKEVFMSRRQYALILGAAFLTTIVIALFSSEMQAQSRRVPVVASSSQSTNTPPAPPSGASTSGWDYRILSGSLSNATNTPRLQRRNAESFPMSSNLTRSLEDRIRELSEQGYEVQSFNVVLPSCNGAAREFEIEAEVVVLLRRMKK
jgi:hypothetical protein